MSDTNKPMNIEAFPSIAHFKKAIETRPNSSFYNNENSSSEGSFGFTKTHSLEEATNLFVNGYDKNLKEIKNFSKTIVNQTENGFRRTKQFVVAGAFASVPRYLNGTPNNMVSFKQAKHTVKTIHIYYDVTAPARIDAKDLEKAGICVAGLIAMLEAQGYRVKIELGYISVGSSDIDVCKILLKDYTDYTNWLKLAYPLTHPSFFRRHMFKWQETTPVAKMHHSCYGRALFCDNTEKECLEIMHKHKVVDENAFFVYYKMVEDNGFDTKRLMSHLQNCQQKL